MENIKEQIIKIFEEHNINTNSIDEKKSLIEAGLVDSMTFVNILLEIEDQLNIEIDFEQVDLASIVSIKGLYDHINSL